MIEGEALTRALRTAVFVFFVIQSVFIGVDWLLFPESFESFLPLRLGLNVVFGLIYFVTSRTHPLLSTFATCYIGGAMLLTVVTGTGGSGSGYYVGLMILFMGVGTMVPLSAKQASWIIGGLYAAYCGIPLFAEDMVVWDRFGLHLFFLGAGGFAGVMSCQILDRMRFKDFVQRKQLEDARDELERMDQAKSRFTANIHHELRTPLTLMLAPLEAMRGGDFGEIPATLQRTLGTMQANGLRLLKLINNLLDLAKVESQQLEVTRRAVELGRLVRDVVEGARPMAARKGLALEMEGFEALPVVHVDPDAMEKVLVNLIGNALKFTERGGITVGAEAVEEGGVHLEVRDTGIGMPREELGRIFDRFAQVDASATRTHEGTGIGLSLVQELVALHGGRAWAESDGPGRGTTMHVVLPQGESDTEDDEEVLLGDGDGRALSAAHSFRALASEMALELEAPAGGRFTELERTVERWEGARGAVGSELEGLPEHPPGTPEVVVAEDNLEMRRLLAFLIGREFRVRPVRNGREALEAVRERAPALVVTDVMMPEMSGTELCGALKADPETRSVPVMLVTSKAEREMKIEGLELGAEDYVTKPFHPRELLARVRSLVRIRQLQEEVAERNASLEQSNRELERSLRELREAEVQLVQAERLAAVGELSAGVAHEVNNPLNFARNALTTLRAYVEDLRGIVERLGELDFSDRDRLLGQLEALRREKEALALGDMADELSELIEIVMQGLDRTVRLVADMRDFAAPHRGERALVDVGAGLRSTLELLGHRLREAGAELEVELPAKLPPVAGDPGALNQVFLNLLKNAAEALEEEGGRIRVVAAAEEGQVVVRIQDGGPGLDSEARARLFEPFFTTKKAGKGTGLGLSISRRIVEGHGGTIEVASQAGEGTCVTVRLPTEREAEIAHGDGA
jgi:signal transduction histidine kinase